MHHKSLVGIAFAMAFLGIGRTRVYGLIKDKELRPVKIGRRTLFALEDLVSFRDQLIHGVKEVNH